MRRNTGSVERRKDLIKLSITDNKAAANIIREYAAKLEKAQTTTDRVRVLSDLLCISETTVFREFANI